MLNRTELARIVKSQLDSLLWSSADGAGENLDEFYTGDDATSELRAHLWDELSPLMEGTMSIELHDALTAYKERFGEDTPSQFGHDLALTRNGHGAGFWDRGLGVAGDVLTAWAESLGELNLFHGEDSIYPSLWSGMFHAEEVR